jgi:hypothetical protein
MSILSSMLAPHVVMSRVHARAHAHALADAYVNALEHAPLFKIRCLASLLALWAWHCGVFLVVRYYEGVPFRLLRCDNQ